MYTKVKTAKEIEAMRESGRMLVTALQTLQPLIIPGVTAKSLADSAAREMKALGGETPILGYHGFPDVICISFNDEVVHGIPSGRVVADGDIVSLDFCAKYRGMITDSAISVIAGRPRDPRHVELLKMTEASLMAGISVVRDGITTGDIGLAVQAVLQPQGKGTKFGIVRDLVGHGVGHELHEDPNIPNYGPRNGKAGSGQKLQAGMTIAIEPMATMTLAGEQVYVAADGWTIHTRDRSWSAHFEHTILITEDGYEILTARV